MFKLKDKNGTILNVATKATYFSLLSTGNYTKVENKTDNPKPQEDFQNNKPRK